MFFYGCEISSYSISRSVANTITATHIAEMLKIINVLAHLEPYVNLLYLEAVMAEIKPKIVIGIKRIIIKIIATANPSPSAPGFGSKAIGSAKILKYA